MSIFKKKKAPAPRTPIEADNTLQSKATGRVLYAICEGVSVGIVGGLKDGGKNLFLNGTPLINADGSENFKGVKWDFRHGLPQQGWMPGFPAVESIHSQDIGLPVEVTTHTPATRSVVNPNANAVRVAIVLNALFDQNVTNGDMLGSKIDFSINVRRQGRSGWEASYPLSIEGKTTSTYEQAYRIELPGDGPWDIQVMRHTADSDRAGLSNSFSLASLTDIVDRKLSYPNTSLLGLEFDAELFGGSMPTVTAKWRGWICRVPTNYSPETRTYSGVWDGSFKAEYTDNPAWLFLQLLTHTAGANLPDSMVDRWALYSAARYCDELVPSGTKNSDGTDILEPRFTAHFVINTRQEAYAVLNSLASTFRAMAYWSDGAIQVIQDAPTDAGVIVSPSNTIGGLEYAGPAARAIHSVAIVSFINEDGDTDVQVYEDPQLIERYGWQPTELTAYACKSKGQAMRLGKWTIETEKLGDTLTYRTSLDHIEAVPGDVIAVADKDIAGIRMGGRVVSADTWNVNVDSPVTIEAGKQYFLHTSLPNGTVGVIEVNLPPGTHSRIVLKTPLPVAPVPEAMWALGASDLALRKFRIIGISDEGDLEYNVAAVPYDPNIYNRVERGINVGAPPWTKIPDQGVVQPPLNPRVERQYISTPTGWTNALEISWDASPDAFVRGYIVRYRRSSNNFVEFNEAPGLTQTIYGESTGQFLIHVHAVNFAGVMSRPAILEANVLDSSPITLLTPSGLELEGQGNNTTFQGRDPVFVWRGTAVRGAYPLGEEPASGAGYLDPIFRDYEVRVYAPNGQMVFSDHTTEPRYVFSFERNSQTVGGPYRAFRFEVLMRDKWGNYSRATSIEVINPAPDQPRGLFADPGFQTIYVGFETPLDLDFAGSIIWIGAESGFVPSAENQVYDGPDNYKVFPQPPNVRRYVRVAHYDSFGKTQLNMSSELVVFVGGVAEVDFIAPAVPTGLKLSSSFTTTEDGTQKYKLLAEWDENKEDDLAFYAVSIFEPGGSPISFTTDKASYEWDVAAGSTYVVQVRAKDKFSNTSLDSLEERLTILGDTEAPKNPTGLTARGALRNVLLNWDQHPDPDFLYMEVWEGTKNDRAVAKPLVAAFGTSYSRVIPEEEYPPDPPSQVGSTNPTPDKSPLPSVERWYWIRAVDRSKNKSDFYPASATGGINAVTGKLKVVDFGPDAVIKAFMIDVGQIQSDHVESISATKIQANTVLSGSVMVDGKYKLSTALDASGNPVEAINAGQTTIDPGKIRIQGSTTLANWKSGGDSTEIRGGAISTNSIRAESLSIGNRQVQLMGISFDAVKDQNIVRWTGGLIIWQGENGFHNAESISAAGHQKDMNQGAVYLCWTPGLGYINFTYDPNIYALNNYIVLGFYYGGSGLVMTYGRTQIDGDYIRTGTISAGHIGVHQLNSDHITNSGSFITAQAMIGSGNIADYHFGDGYINGARITELEAKQIKSGSLTSKRIQVGGNFGEDVRTIVIEGQSGYHAIRYHDQRGVTRVVIGSNRPEPNYNVDGFYVYDLNGKEMISANGFGVLIMGENQLLGGSTVNVHHFPGSPDFGFWSAPNTQNIQNRTLWTLRMVDIGPAGYPESRLWRVVVNGQEKFQWNSNEGFPPNVVIDIPGGVWTVVNLQLYGTFADGSQSWVAYNTKRGNDPFWSVHQYTKTVWTLLEMKR